MVGKPVSPQKLPPAFPWVQVSFVYFTRRLIFLVMLTSPRILSWRVLTGSIGEKTKLFVPEELGSGKNFKIARPAGLRLAVGILLPGKGKPVKGSCGITSPGAKTPLKSPSLSAAVGTLNCRGGTKPRRSRLHSSLQKKKARFFLIGPLKLNP